MALEFVVSPELQFFHLLLHVVSSVTVCSCANVVVGIPASAVDVPKIIAELIAAIFFAFIKKTPFILYLYINYTINGRKGN